MSNEASISTVVLDLFAFFDALSELNCAARKVEELKTSDGAVHKVEAVFKDAVGRDAGLQKTDKGYKIITDCHGLSAEQQKRQAQSIQQVVQRYSYRKVIAQLQREGYTVAEEKKQADGSIKMVVRKWSA